MGGMPIPSLTEKPSCSSRAARAAISSRVQAILISLCVTDGALFDAFFGMGIDHDPMHVYARPMHAIGIDRADVHRTAERRVGQAWFCSSSTSWSPYH